ncbi:MAG: alpha/beta fold hydrolase [Desulfurivibrionaceae bacterium]
MSYLPDSKHYYKKDQFLNYREIGEGPRTIVFLHGFGASNRTWDDILPYLRSSKEYRLILVDLVGSGFSSIPIDSDFSMAANADAVIDFIKAKKLRDYILVGHSFGGGVVLNTILKLDSSDTPKPDALILLDTAAYDIGLPFFVEHLRVPLLGRFLLTVTTPSFRARYTLERIYFDKSKVTDEKVNRYAYFFSLPGNRSALLESAKQIIPDNYADLTSKYKSIDVPTLILWGAQDTALSIMGGRRLAGEIHNAAFVVIDKCGHNPQEEHPEETAREIETFLKSIGG